MVSTGRGRCETDPYSGADSRVEDERFAGGVHAVAPVVGLASVRDSAESPAWMWAEADFRVSGVGEWRRAGLARRWWLDGLQLM